MKNKKRFRIAFLTLLTLIISTCFIYGDSYDNRLGIRLVSGDMDRIVASKVKDDIERVAPGTQFVIDIVDEYGNIVDANKIDYSIGDDIKVERVHQDANKSKNIPAHNSFKITIPYFNATTSPEFRFKMINDSSIKGEEDFYVSRGEYYFPNLIPESMSFLIYKVNININDTCLQSMEKPKEVDYVLHSIFNDDIEGIRINGKEIRPGRKLVLDMYKQYVIEPVYKDDNKDREVRKPATGWKKAENGRWWYESSEVPFAYYHNVTKTFGKNTYRFDQSGWMTTGWYYEGGTWYYHNKKGEGVEGARAKNSWKKIGGKWYYFYKDGKMAKNTKIGSSYVDNSGAWIQDKWVKSGSKYWYSLAGGGYVKNAYKYINGKYYYFDKSGWMKTGWVKYNGQWYYHNKKGEGVEGAMASNEWKKVGSSWYYFGNGGRMATGWNKVGNTWYYHNKRGEGTEGVMVSNQWKKTGSGWYYFDRSGYMATGWNKVGGSWYYHNRKGEGTEGVMVSGGWKKIGSKYYYFYGSGRMAANTYVGGYYVNRSGVWVK